MTIRRNLVGGLVFAVVGIVGSPTLAGPCANPDTSLEDLSRCLKNLSTQQPTAAQVEAATQRAQKAPANDGVSNVDQNLDESKARAIERFNIEQRLDADRDLSNALTTVR